MYETGSTRKFIGKIMEWTFLGGFFVLIGLGLRVMFSLPSVGEMHSISDDVAVLSGAVSRAMTDSSMRFGDVTVPVTVESLSKDGYISGKTSKRLSTNYEIRNRTNDHGDILYEISLLNRKDSEKTFLKRLTFLLGYEQAGRKTWTPFEQKL